MSAGWWRRNALWLVAVPVAVALLLAGSAYRLHTFWWENGYHHETAKADAGQSTWVVSHYKDAWGKTSRRFRVSFGRLDKVDKVPDQLTGDSTDVPAGMTAYRVHLSFRADPREDMNYCQIVLVGDDGALYGGDATDPLGQTNMCVPEDHPGPSFPISKHTRRGQVEDGAERPSAWTVAPYVLVRKGARLTAVRVQFDRPEYATLEIGDSP